MSPDKHHSQMDRGRVTRNGSLDARALQRRIEGYDLARALAIVGMVVVNFKIAMA